MWCGLGHGIGRGRGRVCACGCGVVTRAGRAFGGQARARLAGWRQHGHCRLVERLELTQLVLAQHLEAVDALADRRHRPQVQLRRHVALLQRLAEAQYRRRVTKHLPVVAQPRRGKARAPARRGRGAALVRSDGGGVICQQRHAEQGGRAPPPARRIHGGDEMPANTWHLRYNSGSYT